MLKKLFLISLFSLSLYSSNVIDTNIYTKPNSVAIQFSLDDPFTDSVDFSKKENITYIHIPTVFVKKPKEVLKESELIMFARVFPTDRGTLVKIKEKDKIDVDLSKSNDLYTIRIVIKKKNGSYQLGKYRVDGVGEDVVDMTKNYYIAALFVGFMILILIFAKLFSKKGDGGFFIKNGNSKIPITVEVQKIIDNQNKIVLMKIGSMNYLVLVGSTNMLLDKFRTGQKTTKKEKFDASLKRNGLKIDSYMKKS